MSDILKVTTPVISNKPNVGAKAPVDPANPFSINDPARVVRTHNQLPLPQLANSLSDADDGPVLLMSLLKDPAVAVSYLKNIFLLEEFFKLLPANNQTFTDEIEQTFENLMMDVPEIKEELVRQQNASTSFKGEFFDFLRDVTSEEDVKHSTKQGVATLLRSINNLAAKPDILDAIANSLTYIKEDVNSSEELTTKITQLIENFRAEDSEKNFPENKAQTLNLLQDVESSILFSPKLSKVVSILKYNLSRYNDNTTFFTQSATRLRQLLPPEKQKQYISLLEDFTKSLKNEEFPPQTPKDETITKVMDSLIKLVTIQSENENLEKSEGAKVDNILHSLLSSPCNFTPLLHFIIPVIYQDIRSFAEVWINPQSDEKDMNGYASSGQHFLLVIDIESMGRFEAEIFAHDQTVDFHLYCPKGYEEVFEELPQDLNRVLSNLEYKLGQAKIDNLRQPRSLMQVFKSLPYKRVGVDVKI